MPTAMIRNQALVATIAMPNNYLPSATAASQGTEQVVVISYNSPDIQVIDAVHDTLQTTYHSGVTQFAFFSGGSCQICGVLVDPASNQAILDTAQGVLLLNLTTGNLSAFLPALPAENFAFNPNTRMAVLPAYGSSANVLQTFSLKDNAILQDVQSVGAEPDAAAVDFQTNIAVIPDEFSGNMYMVNLNDQTVNGTIFDAPQTAFPVTFTSCAELWTMVSAESTNHLLFAGVEFDTCIGVAPMPTAPLKGAPPMPGKFAWGHMPSTPDGFAWFNSGDPHGIAVFTSVVSGKPVGFVTDSSGPWIARVDLQGMMSAPAKPNGAQGEIDLTPYVTFLKTQ